jgi:hypothetical protein
MTQSSDQKLGGKQSVLGTLLGSLCRLFSKTKMPAIPTPVATELGEFIWDGGFAWECEVAYHGESVLCVYFGETFEAGAVPWFKDALENLPLLVSLALQRSREKIAVRHHGEDQMRLTRLNIEPDASHEDYHLDFAFASWPDGVLTVRFKDGEVIASYVDDCSESPSFFGL